MVVSIIDENENEIEEVKKPKQIVTVKLSNKSYKNSIIRKKLY